MSANSILIAFKKTWNADALDKKLVSEKHALFVKRKKCRLAHSHPS